MSAKTKNVAVFTLIGTAGVASVVGLCRYIGESLIGEALDRVEPWLVVRVKSRKKRENYLTSAKRELCRKLENSEHEKITMHSFDGTKLVGHLFRAESPKRVILAMHGWRSSWAADFCALSELLLDGETTVLFPEQRGQGDSGGDYMGFGMIERHDAVEWVKWLCDNGFAELPVYLAGISMGASTVLMAAGSKDLPENVRGVIADCGFTSAAAIWEHVSKGSIPASRFASPRTVRSLCRKKLNMEPDAYSTLDAMKNSRLPVLFVHGAADTFVPVSMTLENYVACRAPKKLLIVPGAEHGLSSVVDPARYRAALEEFFAENDKKDTK